jgi:hypothetical protein
MAESSTIAATNGARRNDKTEASSSAMSVFLALLARPASNCSVEACVRVLSRRPLMSAIVKRVGEGISGEVKGCTDGGAEAAVAGVSYCCSVNCVGGDCCVTTGAPVAGVTKFKLA